MKYVVLRIAKLTSKLSTYQWDTLYLHEWTKLWHIHCVTAPSSTTSVDILTDDELGINGKYPRKRGSLSFTATAIISSIFGTFVKSRRKRSENRGAGASIICPLFGRWSTDLPKSGGRSPLSAPLCPPPLVSDGPRISSVYVLVSFL